MKIIHVLLFVCFVVGICAVLKEVPRVSKGYPLYMSMAPWHAGLYTKTTSPYKQICGGTVIAKNIVVTAAHCVTEGRLVLPVSQFAVAAGKIYRPWNDTHDVGAQKSDASITSGLHVNLATSEPTYKLPLPTEIGGKRVYPVKVRTIPDPATILVTGEEYTVNEIKVPPRYQGAVTNFQHDIALLLLTAEFNYTRYVKAACLNFDAVHDAEQLKDQQGGKVVGWGLTGENSLSSQVLQGATMPNVAIDKCIEQSPASFRSSITGDKICAGYNNGTAVCRGDSGGGLVFRSIMNNQWVMILRGIVSTSPATENLCNIYTWATFTHLLPHEHFVKASVPNVEEGCGTPANGVVATRLSLGLGRNYECPCTCPEQ